MFNVIAQHVLSEKVCVLWEIHHINSTCCHHFDDYIRSKSLFSFFQK